MKRLKWGLIGCGNIVKKRVAPAIRDLQNCDLVAVNRARFELAESFAKEFGARKWYRTYQELLNDNEIDSVYIATPADLHCTQTVAAAESGKHVLCEKPMAMNTAECDKMIAACRASNVKLGIAYYRHFYPVIDRIKRIMSSGEIGRIVFVQINAFEHFNPRPDDIRYWFVKKDRAGGGPMFDFGCHRIEVILNMFNSVKFIKGFISKIVFEREVEDTATAFFRCTSGPNAVLNVTHAAYESQDTLDIFGTEGSIHVSVLNSGIMTVKTKNGERTEKYPPDSNIHLPLIDDFTRAVLDDREPAVDADTGREVSRIEEHIYNGWNFV